MTYGEYRAKTHEMVNEINDICATAVVTDQMTFDDVITYYRERLDRIYTVCCYPEDIEPAPPARETKIVRRPLECQPFGDKGLVRYQEPMMDWCIVGRPGELFEQLREILDGKAIERSIIRVVDGKDIVIWQQAYQCAEVQK